MVGIERRQGVGIMDARRGVPGPQCSAPVVQVSLKPLLAEAVQSVVEVAVTVEVLGVDDVMDDAVCETLSVAVRDEVSCRIPPRHRWPW
jgi:hypothetical protein